MKLTNALIALLLLVTIPSYGQGWLPVGTRSNSMANASVCNTDVWAYHHNPGALGEVKTFSAGLSYTNRFLLKDFQSQALALAIPMKVGVLSVGAQLYGHDQFRSQRAGIGYGLKLAEKFYAGVQLNYQGIVLNENYGSSHGVTAEVGLQALLTEKWRIGVSMFNVTRSKLSNYQDDRLTTVMRLGTNYLLSKKVLLAAEVNKDVEQVPRFSGGVEYQAVENLFIRAGAGSGPTEFTFGLGYKYKSVQLDLGSAYHQVLGWSPHFSITYSGAEKK